MRDKLLTDFIKFQFKHCTIISLEKYIQKTHRLNISIQALYDYKSSSGITIKIARHISIQALYDYKVNKVNNKKLKLLFQFKHCTIISKD